MLHPNCRLFAAAVVVGENGAQCLCETIIPPSQDLRSDPANRRRQVSIGDKSHSPWRRLLIPNGRIYLLVL